MYIINQKKNRIFNIDQFQQIFLMDNVIQCKWGSEVCVLGTYETADRAKGVFNEMMGRLFYPDMVVMQNCEVSDTFERAFKDCQIMVVKDGGEPKADCISPSVWYMPEA